MAILYGTLPNGSLVPVEADAQGRLVAELDGGVPVSNWERTGTTLSPSVPGDGIQIDGNIQGLSLNGSQLAGFRNVLINGNLTINQRGIEISSAPIDTYGQDRWKRTSGGMIQIVEAGNFEPGSTYTLSGVGVTTQQLTAPVSGNWTIPEVPVTARKIQLEPGPVATPFEHRPIGTELSLCQRYYQAADTVAVLTPPNATDQNLFATVFFQTRMRAIPTVNIESLGAGGATVSSISGVSITARKNQGNTNREYLYISSYSATAEL